MERRKFEAKLLLKDKKFWFASFLVVWAAALQRQDSFKQKFGTLDEDKDQKELAENTQ